MSQELINNLLIILINIHIFLTYFIKILPRTKILNQVPNEEPHDEPQVLIGRGRGNESGAGAEHGEPQVLIGRGRGNGSGAEHGEPQVLIGRGNGNGSGRDNGSGAAKENKLISQPTL
ncbi:hypothetical protein BpHYR1_035321 [Brachionus plicatilis]|uniref:Uncharacterized protein n=1 Tax=Brachionus plicatilis TaxID=10195 RepID=A0A3M7RIK0_BRAPC|nr:hypothetical protein BpHYR1_035321 [Brachionus plicatilis]